MKKREREIVEKVLLFMKKKGLSVIKGQKDEK